MAVFKFKIIKNERSTQISIACCSLQTAWWHLFWFNSC